jgi:Lar family restriction alleviation protein
VAEAFRDEIANSFSAAWYFEGMKIELTEEAVVEKTTSLEVKPCPFCGSEDVKAGRHKTGETDGRAWVECAGCEAIITEESYNIGYGDDLDGMLAEAVRKWNRRA